MKALTLQPKLVQQVHDAIVADIAEGKLRPGERMIQEQIATVLGVSRQPVQQALLLLRNEGVVHDVAGRGLVVAPLDARYVRNMYDIRAVMEGLAFRRAAELESAVARKLLPRLLEKGRKAVDEGSVADMIAADLELHEFVYGLADNHLIAPTLGPQWAYTQRVMGKVLMQNGHSHRVWNEHAAMLDAVMAGDGAEAERLARQHISAAAATMIEHLGQASRDRARHRVGNHAGDHTSNRTSDHAGANASRPSNGANTRS